MALPFITMTGNLVSDPELRFTQSGSQVIKFRVATGERVRDRQTNEWKDGDSCFLDVEVWRDQAENIAESLMRGTMVTVTGRLRQRSYEKDGERRWVYEVKGDDVAVSLQRQTAKVSRVSKSDSAPASSAPAAAAPAAAAAAPAPAAAPAGAPTGSGTGFLDEPPF